VGAGEATVTLHEELYWNSFRGAVRIHENNFLGAHCLISNTATFFGQLTWPPTDSC